MLHHQANLIENLSGMGITVEIIDRTGAVGSSGDCPSELFDALN
jgi:hypothetical protein